MDQCQFETTAEAVALIETTENVLHPYQIMPPLSDDEYTALKTDIAERGVMVPVEKDELGNVLDGHNRVRICEELGVTDYPCTVRYYATDAEKRSHVRALNLSRRHLTQAQRRDLIAEQLRDTPEKSDRQIAAGLGVSHHTVNDVRGDLQSGGQIAHLTHTVGADGKEYPRSVSRPVTITAATPAETERALDMFPKLDLSQLRTDKPLTVKELHKELRAADRADIRAIGDVPEIPDVEFLDVRVRLGDWFRLGQHLVYCGDSTDAVFVDNAPACPFAFADPPYNVGKAEWDFGFVWGHDWLADKADVVAVTPGATGLQVFLQRTRMPYRWIFNAWIKNGMTRGAMGFCNVLHALLFAHGSVFRSEQDFMEMIVSVSDTGDTAHPSRKPLPFVARLLQIYTSDGDSVIDPFLGSGTTLFAAQKMNRACYAAEISPQYVAETLARYEYLTGEPAQKEANPW